MEGTSLALAGGAVKARTRRIQPRRASSLCIESLLCKIEHLFYLYTSLAGKTATSRPILPWMTPFSSLPPSHLTNRLIAADNSICYNQPGSKSVD